MMMLKYSIVFVLFISLSTFSNQVTELTCYGTTFSPYSFVKNGVVSGINIDLISAISKQLNISVTFEIMPWRRLLQNIAADKIECATAFFKTSTRVNNMIFMEEPLSITDYTIFIHKKNAHKYKNLKDLDGTSIGVNRGFKTMPEFENAVHHYTIKKYEVGDEQQSFQMLSTFRLQGVLTDYTVGIFNIKELELRNIISLEPPLKSIPVFLVFSKKIKEKGLVKIFDQALLTLKQNGTYQTILDKYLLNSNQ
jgi:polar amino acid transport system substrate-binding protein